MITVPEPLQQLLHTQSLRLSMLWKLTRNDGTVYNLTNHDTVLTFEGDDYSPVSALSGSARARVADLQEGEGTEFTGVLSASIITESDLRAGLFNDAVLLESVVSWMYPWAGAITQVKYFVRDISYTGEIWTAKLEGISSPLKVSIGETYNRNCSADLGDARCKFALVTETAKTVSSITAQRLTFQTNLAGTQSDDYYKYGKLTWTAGANNGQIHEIKSYTDSTGELTLRTKTANDITLSDTFNIHTGCDKLFTTCDTKFSNTDNFRAYRFLTSFDEANKLP